MKKVLVILAPGFEEIEAVTVIDLLRRADIEVTIAGLERDSVTGSHEISLVCDNFYDDVSADNYDVLFLPGGQPGTNNLKKDQKIVDMVRQFHQNGKLLAAICAAPTVLHEAGILIDKHVTSYPSERDSFTQSHYHEEDVITDGNIITSRGVGTVFDFALALVKIIQGRDRSAQLAEQILWTIK